MRKLVVFNLVTVDGYFADIKGDMSWAHRQPDPEWDAFGADNASSGGMLVFGRVTYQIMESYWPTPQAMKGAPDIAEGMNSLQKIVFSRTLDKVSWKNTKLVKSDMADEIRNQKKESGPHMVIMGSGSIVAQLTNERLIDEYQFVVNPLVLGKGKSMFEGIKEKLSLTLTKSRIFGNGNVLLCYEPMK